MRKITVFIERIGHLLHTHGNRHYRLQSRLYLHQFLLLHTEEGSYSHACRHGTRQPGHSVHRCFYLLVVVRENTSLGIYIAHTVLHITQFFHCGGIFLRSLLHPRHLFFQVADFRTKRNVFLGGLLHLLLQQGKLPLLFCQYLLGNFQVGSQFHLRLAGGCLGQLLFQRLDVRLYLFHHIALFLHTSLEVSRNLFYGPAYL